MSRWRAFADRFRDPENSDDDSLEATAPLPDLHASGGELQLFAEGVVIDSAGSPESCTSRDAYGTRPLGDTTALLPSAPQSVGVDGGAQFSAAARRDVGRERAENQDRCFAQILLQPDDEHDLTLGLFIVADGMGGHHDGDQAARLALATVVQHVLTAFAGPRIAGESPRPQPILKAAVQAANTAIYESGQASARDMGTTCTAALLVDDQLIVAHVGDSRALLIGNGARVLTTDHTAVGRLITIGTLSRDDARAHPLRNQLYRSVGQQPHVIVDTMATTWRDETHLLLCSDGLWGLVPESEMCAIVQEAPSPEVAAARLIARANLLGGDDNIAVVVVALPPTGAAV